LTGVAMAAITPLSFFWDMRFLKLSRHARARCGHPRLAKTRRGWPDKAGHDAVGYPLTL
jgi:hypothetical protein